MLDAKVIKYHQFYEQVIVNEQFRTMSFWMKYHPLQILYTKKDDITDLIIQFQIGKMFKFLLLPNRYHQR